MVIKFYKTNEPHGYMSNYWKARFVLDGKLWETTEHYYQAMKTLNVEEQEQVRNAVKANDARLLGQKVTLRADFNEVKDQLMKTCLFAKFTQHPDLKKQLLDTGDAELIEDSPVDFYWGCGKDGSGQNKLGKLLMELRKEFSNKKSSRDFQKYDVCLDKNGNMTERYYYKPDPKAKIPSWHGPNDNIYVPNHIFKDTLVFEACYPTKGSAHFIFRSINSNRVFSFFLSDFELILKSNQLKPGNILQGEFTYCKRGSSQGLIMILD